MKLKIFDYFYIVIVLFDLFAMIQYPGLRLISKPLIVTSLLIFYIMQTQEKQQPVILTGLLFALIGDIFLLFDYPLFFQLGIAAFLIMQICYIIFFKRYYVKPQSTYILYSILIALFAISFVSYTWSALGDYKYPVLAYAIAISVMVYYGINQKLDRAIIIGSCLFMVSDLSLAYEKFIFKTAILPPFVMITYALAQYYIVRGVAKVKSFV